MEIQVTEVFKRCVKPLAKRYRSFRKDYQDLLDDLEKLHPLRTCFCMSSLSMWKRITVDLRKLGYFRKFADYSQALHACDHP